MNFKFDYPELASFLLAWFPDADLEGMSDSNVVDEYFSVTPTPKVSKVISDARLALKNLSETWEAIGIHANRAFANPDEAQSWLSMVIERLASNQTRQM